MKRSCVVLAAVIMLTAMAASSVLAAEPSLSLKDSIAVAEGALTLNKIDLSGYYLYSITFSRSSKGDYWYYTYRPKQASEYNEVFVKVYMDKSAEVTHSGSSKTIY